MMRRRIFTAAVGAALAAATTMALVTPATATPRPVAAHQPDAGALGARWTATARGPQQYPRMNITWDVPIRMSDGVVLKANVYRPADASGRAVDVKTPVIVNMTPYTKLVSALASAALNDPPLAQPLVDFVNSINLSGTPVSGLGDLLKAIPGGGLRTFTVDPKLVESGYTQVVVDVRGTGFSQGTWQVLQSREQQDTVETIDWAAQQPWSDGKVGMSGVSYSAINQVQAASHRPGPLKAIFPVEPGGDILRDVVAPGGGLGIGFMPAWLLAVNGTKWIPNVQSMLNGTFDWKWLADRQKDPLTFMDLLWAALTVPTVQAIPEHLKVMLDPKSSLRSDLLLQPQKIDIPTMVYGGWHDLFTNSEPRIYNAIPLPTGEKQLVMGDTYHLDPGSAMGTPGNPPGLDVLQRAWFDHWLKGIDNGIQTYGPITSWQQGNGWTTLDEFPRPGMTYRRMYLGGQSSGTAPYAVHDGTLSQSVPGGKVSLTVAPGLTTLCSRDASQETMGVTAVLDVCGKDSRIAERDALSFTSAPVTAPTAISGPVNLHLNTVLDATDGYWTATLNDVAPDGTSTVLTSGQLTASLRAVDESKSSRSANGDLTDPVHIMSLATRKPIVPGQPTTLDVGLTATDAVLKPGHRLRVDVFASNFPKGMLLRPLLNESGLKPQHLVLDPSSPSFVNVPLSEPIG